MSTETESIRWGAQYLLSHGYELKHSQTEVIQNTPWSHVVRFDTADGYIYLKQTPEKLFLEASIIQVLRERFQAPVASIIAKNTILNCFLMKDAGKPLRGILKNKFDATLINKGIDSLTSMQLSVADHLDVFLDMGVPDWRLAKFPKLYHELISQKEMLLEDGLSAMEISKLETLTPTVSLLSEKLSNYKIKESIVQPDFNDNNSLIDLQSGKITLIDLGEIAISHPYFSLLNCLRQMKKHHGITEGTDPYLQIQDACLSNFIKYESQERLVEAFSVADILYPLYWSFSNYRLISACDKQKFTSAFDMQGRYALSLKEFMTEL